MQSISALHPQFAATKFFLASTNEYEIFFDNN
jgi:hypothetical protein